MSPIEPSTPNFEVRECLVLSLLKTSPIRAAYLRARPGRLLCNIHRILFPLSVVVVLYTYSYKVLCRDRLGLEDLEEGIDEERREIERRS
jgi:hypothetical protein